MAEIWVFSEKSDLLAEFIGGAKGLAQGSAVTALVLGPRMAAERAISCGADRAIWLGEAGEGRLVEDYVPTLAKLFEGSAPHLLLVGSTRRGRVVAGRLAARLNKTVLTDVTQFSPQGDGLQIQHMVWGGGAVRVEKPLVTPVIATVGPGVFQAQADSGAGAGEIVEAPFVEPEHRAKLRERKPRQAATVNLNAARRVVCLGRGVGQQSDVAMVEELARALGAELACTRPLAEGLGWLPRERYIGISGANIRPDLYVGVGVSGQVQHLIGMNRARVVVAINKDANAPIFQQADYGIVGDLYEVVPQLIKQLKRS